LPGPRVRQMEGAARRPPRCLVRIEGRGPRYLPDTSRSGRMIATCLRLIFDGIVRGSSGQRMLKSRLSMAVMIAGRQPTDSSGYFAMTYEPTRSVSQ
jgi:hypothetical protein